MAANEPESLESLLNKATNPANADEDWEAIMAFCDQVNKELEGPQIAVRLLAHKIQSPQTKESMYALQTLESCVKNCGKRFHQEIGKFRFLNEIIKVISPKYLGNHMSESVKKRCIELMYGWSQGLKHEPKLEEAYQMLKRQGIVTEDPTYIDKTFEPPPPPRDRNAVFEDEEKSKVLARLLKSKHPEDLQAANRLIKNMVKQDIERMEKTSKRLQELETVTNNIQLLKDMLDHYYADTATSSELDVMKELYDNIEKRRPNLFRLASDTGESEADAMAQILKVNDDVVKVMTSYKKIVEGKTEENGLDTLYDPKPKAEIQGPRIGLTDVSTAKTPSSRKDDLDALSDIFGATSGTGDTSLLSGLDPIPSYSTASASTGGLLDLNPPPSTQQPFYSMMSQPPLVARSTSSGSTLSSSSYNTGAIQAGMFSTAGGGGGGILGGMTTTSSTSNNSLSKPNKPQTGASGSGLDNLSSLGQSLLHDSLVSTGKQTQAFPQKNGTSKVPMNQLGRPAAAATTAAAAALIPQSSPLLTPTGSVNASPAKSAAAVVPVQPLTDVFVALETIQPGTTQPLNPFDKHNVKVMMHIGKDRPRDDVVVVVISVMSTNTTAAVKSFSFQAAVPKSMKVKLQPASASALPVYNPILPPAAITQVMLIANPQKEKIRLKYKLTFTLNEDLISDIGDVDNFPVQ